MAEVRREPLPGPELENGSPGTSPVKTTRGITPMAISQTSTRVNHTGSWKYIRPVHRDRVAPCNARCPVGIDIEAYMNLLREGRIWEAQDVLLRENPMPAVTGRVCDHPCELACNRVHMDGSVSIHTVERGLGDQILDQPLPDFFKPWRTESVCVIGSGPAGLACAYHLNRLGYRTVILESEPEPGGMLRVGIPEYRLPRPVLDKQIAWLEAQGIEIRCNEAVGTDLDWEDLTEFAAVFVATGAHRSRRTGMEGEDGSGVRPGLEFLRDVNAGELPILGREVAVVGGGNTAMDCARAAIRLGASVTVVYRRTREEMPAIAEEIEAAEREGARFIFQASPVEAMRTNGTMRGITCERMEMGPEDESGRRRPVPSQHGGFTLMVDSVLTAIGESTELEFLPPALRTGGGVLRTDYTGEVELPDEFGEDPSPATLVFAGGDVADQPRTVAHAMGAGKRAALGIDRALHIARGKSIESWDPTGYTFGPEGNVSMTRWRGDDPVARENPVNEVVEFEDLNLNHFRPAPPLREHHIDPLLARSSFREVNRGLLEDEVLQEARRCFNCGVCNGCDLCMIFCPDFAILRRPDGGYDIDLEYCKGCGVCAEECPRGAITMTREGV
jgi:2-oxoacid:acceptor oxidoreductase delta subunit (pyruvate/2-ketoisovalerate family)